MKTTYLFLLIALCGSWTSCSDENRCFITPHNGSIVINSVMHFDSIFECSFSGFEGLYYKMCDSSAWPCYKLIPSSESIDSYYQVEYAKPEEMLAKVGQLPVDYLIMDFYVGQSDSVIMKLINESYQSQGYQIRTTETTYRPWKYTNDVVEHTIYGTKNSVECGLCQYSASVTNNLVGQIKVLKNYISE